VSSKEVKCLPKGNLEALDWTYCAISRVGLPLVRMDVL